MTTRILGCSTCGREIKECICEKPVLADREPEPALPASPSGRSEPLCDYCGWPLDAHAYGHLTGKYEPKAAPVLPRPQRCENCTKEIISAPGGYVHSRSGSTFCYPDWGSSTGNATSLTQVKIKAAAAPLRSEEPSREGMSERLSHASGALADIYVTVTDCVPKNCDPKLAEIAESVVQRILCSAHKVHNPPNWFRHEWEERQWKRYEAGEFNACASDQPCKEVAAALASRSSSEVRCDICHQENLSPEQRTVICRKEHCIDWFVRNQSDDPEQHHYRCTCPKCNASRAEAEVSAGGEQEEKSK